MFDARTLAAAAGLTIELADLGDWGDTRLIAEFDARARTIRINQRALDAYARACGAPTAPAPARQRFVDLAVAHELYHQGEAAGTIGRAPTRAGREAAADAWARARVPVDPRLAAFLAQTPTGS